MRGTGRTTRMLREAITLSEQGRAVYVIGANAAHKNLLRDLCAAIAPNNCIKFETPDSPSNFDWMTMRLCGAHPNCVVLVDHYAIEYTFSAVLEMLHRYDAQSTAQAEEEKQR